MTLRHGARATWTATALSVCLVLLMAASAAADLCPRVKFVTLDDKTVSVGWTLGIDERDIEEFGGYRVWVREAWNQDEFSLAREYVWGVDDTSAAGYWSFEPFYIDSIRVYTNRSLQNAFPYQVSVTAFEEGVQTVNEECREENSSGIVYPRAGVQSNLSKIQAIPNPYRAAADWEYGGERRISFVGLPGPATIRIYTAAGKLVRTISHQDASSDQASWDLKNSDGDGIAPGVYLWAVDSDEGSVAGKIMIIK